MDTLHIGVELINPSKRGVHVNTVKFDIEPLSVYRSLWRYIEGVDKSKCHLYSNINSTKSPAAGVGNVSEPMLISHVGRVREVVCSYICIFLLSVEVSVFVCLRSSHTHVTEVRRPQGLWDLL